MPSIFLRVGTAFIAALAISFLHTTPLHGNEDAWLPAALSSTYIKKVETTPWYLIAGENNAKIWEQPFNGIYYSADLGKTWGQLGLKDRGITDLDSHNNKIYATTYYSVSNLNGLFISEDKGQTFYQSGPNKTATDVEVTDNTIYVGTINHGLWVSTDSGTNWERKIGVETNYPGSKIIGLVAGEHVVISVTPSDVYRSENVGETWEKIISISGKQLSNFYIKDKVIFAGASNTDGMYISQDLGKTWNKVLSWGDFPTGAIYYLNGYFYASKLDNEAGKYRILKTNDLGNTWVDTGFDSPSTQSNITSYTELKTDKTYLYAAAPADGIYSQVYEKAQPEFFQFLDIPWAYNTAAELVDKITAFFDHEYPLLGYNYFSEPEDKSNTVTNFYGVSGKPPDYYYSAHNGMDFKMDYGADVLAPASGFAKYYFCTDCGHSIKIDHQNGYESIFMHLQNTGLITTNTTPAIWVNTGDKIGNVGMTGRTSGPHIHFGITTNKPYPSGLVDPFGWLDMTKGDPWEQFSWADNLGQHQGSKSNYLWKVLIQSLKQYITNESEELVLDNISLKVPMQTNNTKLTVNLSRYIQPFIPQTQQYLKYIPLTSLFIGATDYYGNNISELENEAEIKFVLNTLDLSNIIKESIKIYFWDELENIWKPLPTILNLIDDTATAYTDHFSQFAMFGEKSDQIYPETQIVLTGQVENDWYIDYPSIVFSTSSNDTDKTYFQLSTNNEWQVYEQEFHIQKDGLLNILYRSKDISGNYELTKNQILKINTSGIWKSSANIVSSRFVTN